MFGETTISYVKIGNHPIETTIYKWLFGVPGTKTPQQKNAEFFDIPNRIQSNPNRGLGTRIDSLSKKNTLKTSGG